MDSQTWAGLSFAKASSYHTNRRPRVKGGVNYALFLGRGMFGEYFDAIGGFELTDESWIPGNGWSASEARLILSADTPEFTCNAEVFATPHQRIALASFGCGWDSRRIEVLLLAPRDSYQPRNYPSKPQHLTNRLGNLMGTCQGTRARILC